MKFLKRGDFKDKPTALDLFHMMAEDGNSGSHFCSKALYINLKPKDYIYTHIKFTAMHKYINFFNMPSNRGQKIDVYSSSFAALQHCKK